MKRFLRFGNQIVITVPDDSTLECCIENIIDNTLDRFCSDAFHMVSLSTILYKWRHWFECMQTIHPFYAVKANPDPVILRFLAALGANFDCASQGEIHQVLHLGIDPERIIFANTCKPINALRYARKVGVDLMTVDNEEELLKIKEHFPNARLVIRIQIGDPTALVQLSKKFGIEPQTRAPNLLRTAVDMGLSVVGVSFHVGGMCKDATTYDRAIAHARKLFDLGNELGQTMSLVDIGGGYPGYCSEDVSLAKIAKVVNESKEKHFGDLENVSFIAEPGRYFAMPSATVCAQVFAKRQCEKRDIDKESEEDDQAFMYYITDGVFGSFNCVPVYDIRPPFNMLGKTDAKAVTYPSRIWGPTCDSADCLYDTVDIPQLQIGDWLSFEGMGAYSRCIASMFNGFDIPTAYYVVTETDSEFVAKLLEQSSNSLVIRPVHLELAKKHSFGYLSSDSAFASPASLSPCDSDMN